MPLPLQLLSDLKLDPRLNGHTTENLDSTVDSHDYSAPTWKNPHLHA